MLNHKYFQRHQKHNFSKLLQPEDKEEKKMSAQISYSKKIFYIIEGERKTLARKARTERISYQQSHYLFLKGDSSKLRTKILR